MDISPYMLTLMCSRTLLALTEGSIASYAGAPREERLVTDEFSARVSRARS